MIETLFVLVGVVAYLLTGWVLLQWRRLPGHDEKGLERK